MRIYKFGKVFEWLYPQRTWSKKENEKIIYLTFDDGPIPEVTPWVLECLEKYQVKATFFMVGENVVKHNDVFQMVVDKGHRVANHTYNHLKGTLTETQKYIDNTHECQKVLQGKNTPALMRPPYGKISKGQEKILRRDYEIVMWSVLSNDFVEELSPDECLAKTIAITKNGSVVLFHDSTKTFHKIKYVLPRYLEKFTNLGYEFCVL